MAAHTGVPDHVSLWGLLTRTRRGFRQYVNLPDSHVAPALAGALERVADDAVAAPPPAAPGR